MKKIVIIILLMGLMLSSSGCNWMGGGAKKAPAKRITLKIWRLFDSEEIMKPIIADYIDDRRDDFELTIEYQQKEYEEYVETTTNALAAGQGPDIWMIRNDWVAREYDKLEPMSDKIMTEEQYRNIFPQIVVNDNVIDGKIYGMPWSVDTLALYYNQNIFNQVREEAEEAGIISKEDNILEEPPANWEELIRASKLLVKKNGDNIERAGIALGTVNNVAHAIDILTVLMLQNHSKMISDDKLTATFNLAIQKQSGEPVYAGTKALEFYKSFADPSKETYTWNPGMPDSVQAFMEGKTAMMIDYSYIQKTIFENAPTFTYSIAPLPQIKDAPESVDYSSYWVETVTNNCANPDVAWDFINYVRDRKLNDYLTATKRPAPYKIVDEDVPIVKERSDDVGATFSFQLNTAQNWYKGKFPDKVDDVFYELIENVSRRNQSTQSAIDAAAAKTTTWLQKEPY